MFRTILALACLVTSSAAADIVPVDGPNGVLAIDSLRLVLKSGDTVDLAPLVGTDDNDWRIQSTTCFDPECSAGFVGLAQILDDRTGMLAGFDLDRMPVAHLIIDRGYDFTARVAPVGESTAILLTKRSVRFARPGPCGTRACQAMQRSVSMLKRDDDGFWRPERPLRAYDSENEDLRLFQLAAFEQDSVILEVSTEAGLTWHSFDSEGRRMRIELPSGRILSSYTEGFIVNAELQSDVGGGDALTLARLPAHCTLAPCTPEDLTLIGSLDYSVTARQLTTSRDGEVFVTEYRNGSSRLERLDPAEPNGRRLITPPVEQASMVTSPQALSAGLAVIVETFSGVERFYALSAEEDPRWTLLVSRDRDPLAVVETRHVASIDGVEVPWRRITPAGPSQACRPTLISAYGGFGLATPPGGPHPLEQAWLDAGGAIVFAHVRGDGAYGPDWAAAGEADRWRTIQDLEAVARELLASGQAHHSSLVIEGASFGGLISLAASSRLDPPPAVTISSSTPVDDGASSFTSAITQRLDLTPAFSEAPPPVVILTANGNDRRVPPQKAQIWRTLLTDAGSATTVLEFAGLSHVWRGVDHPTVTAAEMHLYRSIRDAMTPIPDCGFTAPLDDVPPTP